MVRTERQREILSILRSEGFTSAKSLSERLYISESSIRRDLGALERGGLVKRSYGGAEIISSANAVLSFDRRSYENTDLKKAIAEKARCLIKGGDIIFLEQSSTCFFLAEAIMNMSDVTVVTNNLQIIHLLSDSDIKLICTGGGVFKRNKNCLIGSVCESGFASVHADIAFFSTKAISDEGVIYDCTEEEVSLRRALLQNAKKRVYLCDSSKFGSTSAYRQCSLEDIDAIVSDGENPTLREKFPQVEFI